MSRVIRFLIRRVVLVTLVAVATSAAAIAVISFDRVLDLEWDSRTDPRTLSGRRCQVSVARGQVHLTSTLYNAADRGIWGVLSRPFDDGRTKLFFDTWRTSAPPDRPGFWAQIEDSLHFQLDPNLDYFHAQFPAWLVTILAVTWPMLRLLRIVRFYRQRQSRGFSLDAQIGNRASSFSDAQGKSNGTTVNFED